MTRKPRSYGTSRSGAHLTDDLIARKAQEAEAGLDVARLRPRRGRPPIGSGAAAPFPVRLDPELRRALDDRAAADHMSASAVIREALRQFLGVR